MRLDESTKVVEALESIGLKIHLIDGQPQPHWPLQPKRRQATQHRSSISLVSPPSRTARERFYCGRTTIHGQSTPMLKETTKPETKRKIIGDTFMTVCEAEVRRLGLTPEKVFLAQGTLRPDLIESASTIASVAGHADVIKTHHNDTELVRELRAKGRIIEPLKDLHKDEVRLLGLELGLPPHLIWRQPFPGPGLAVRILCAVEPYVTGEEESIVTQLQSFATDSVRVSLLPCRTVGVQGDQRSYSHLVALSSDSTSDPFGLAPNWHTLFHLAKQIPKQVHGVNRVVYVFGKPLTHTRYTSITPTLLTPDVIHQLQLADDIVNRVLVQYDLLRSLSQVPVILFPVSFADDGTTADGKRSICIRTFVTNDFMTGVPARPVADEQSEQAAAQESPSPRPSPTPSPEVAQPDAYASTGSHPVAAVSAAEDPFLISPVDVCCANSDPSHSMTRAPLHSARFPTMPLRALQEMVQQILAQVPDIGRVCFDLTSKPPATTEWE